MLSENLKTIRKNKGFSQEELAARINVVRQTVSKWEKGLSVPDSELLIKIAEVLEVSVSDLLGEKIEKEESKTDIAEQLMKINEQLIIKNNRSKRIWKTIAILIVILFVLPLIFIIVSAFLYSPHKVTHSETVSETEIDDEPTSAVFDIGNYTV